MIFVQTTNNLCLLITVWLIAEYKHSIKALAALEKLFRQQYSATSRTPYLCRDFTSSQFNVAQKWIGL